MWQLGGKVVRFLTAVEKTVEAKLDHIIPRALGGGVDSTNIHFLIGIKK